MFRLHVNKRGQVTLPKLLREWMEVKAGDDLAVYYVDGEFVIRQPGTGEGSLDDFAHVPAQHGRSVEESVGEYLGGLDERSKRSA